MLLSEYNVAVRAIPYVVYSFSRGFYSPVDLDSLSKQEVYAAGFKVGQSKRGVADAVFGAVVGTYISLGVFYLALGM